MSSVGPLSGKESNDFERDHCRSRIELMQVNRGAKCEGLAT
jgi:hypothetical protein